MVLDCFEKVPRTSHLLHDHVGERSTTSFPILLNSSHWEARSTSFDHRLWWMGTSGCVRELRDRLIELTLEAQQPCCRISEPHSLHRKMSLARVPRARPRRRSKRQC